MSRAWHRAGLPPTALAEPELLVPTRSLARFIDDSARSQGIEALGTFGAAIRSAGTLGNALRTASESVASYNSSVSYWITLDGDRARVCRRFADVRTSSRQIDLFTVAVLTNLLRLAAGPDWTPSRIELQTTGPLDLRERGILGDAAVEVGGAVTSIEFPRELLSRRLGPPPAPLAVPSVTSLTEWQRSAPPRDFLRSFDVLLAGLVQTERSDVEAAADAAGMTVRSLQRRLAQCGSSYSQMLDGHRCRTALKMLDDPSLKIIDVAVTLGYSDAAHFTRAFHRWRAMGPLEYRRTRNAAFGALPERATLA